MKGSHGQPEGASPPSPPRLTDQVRDRIRRLGLSLRTEEAYCRWIRRFIVHHGKRHPREMGAPEVEAFLTELARRRGVAASTQNQALVALLFPYREVLRVDLPWLGCQATSSGPSARYGCRRCFRAPRWGAFWPNCRRRTG